MLVQKLSGFAKFELDHKLSANNLYQIVEKLSRKSVALSQEATEEKDAPEETTFSEEEFEALVSVFEKALKDNTPPFQGDLENETYKSILQSFRDWKE